MATLQTLTQLYRGSKAGRTTDSRTYVEVFQVLFDTPASAYEAIRATGLPRMGNAHADDPNAFLIKRDVIETANRALWVVNCEYEYQAFVHHDNPVDDDDLISITTRKLTMVVEKDVDGKAIVNSAKDKFDPPVEQPISKITLTIQCNQASISLSTIESYTNSVNKYDITICGMSVDSKCGYLDSISATWNPDNEHGYSWWTVTYKINIDTESFDREILDQGLYYLDGGTKKRIKVGGKDAEEPQRLDGSGGVLADSDPSEFLPFSTYKQKNWDNLNLPSALPS